MENKKEKLTSKSLSKLVCPIHLWRLAFTFYIISISFLFVSWEDPMQVHHIYEQLGGGIFFVLALICALMAYLKDCKPRIKR